jgi:hypothetical protein
LKIKFALVITILVLALAVATPLQSAKAQTNQTNLDIHIVRIVAVGIWGVTHVTDIFTIHNIGTAAASSLDFGFSRLYRNNVYYARAKDSKGKELLLDADVGQGTEIYWMRAHFAQELSPNQTYVFTVLSVLNGVLTHAPGGYEYNFTAAPILTQDATYANVTFIGAPGSTFVLPSPSPYQSFTYEGQPALFKQFKPWKANSNDTFYAPYRTVGEYIVDLSSVERDINVGNTGVLSITDTYNLHNIGIEITSITISLPEGASNVMAYDVVGAMWANPENPSPPYQITISPRYSSGIGSGQNFTFTLTYNLPQSQYLKQLKWWGTYNLTIGLLNNADDFLFDRATVKLITPSGVTVTDVKTPTQSSVANPIQYDPTGRAFALQGVTNQNNVTVGLTLNYLPFWSAYAALPWIFGLELVIAAFALAVVVRRGPELAVPVPVEKLREFVGLYDERLALSRELVVMEEEVARGGLVKHEFRRRTKVMELRLDEINKSLMEVKAELRGVTPRYDELIRRIDRAEAEIHVSRASLSQVRSQYRSGKTTRETYDAMLNDITRRIDRAEETVETILITLREDAR